MFICIQYYCILCLPAGVAEAASASSASSSSSSSFVNGATSKNLPAVQKVAPMPEDTVESMRYNIYIMSSFTQHKIHFYEILFLIVFVR